MSGSFDYHELKVLTERIGKELEDESLMPELLGKVGLKFVRQVKKATPVQTGNLRRKWYIKDPIKSGGGWSVEVANNAEYAEFVNNGHRIVNRQGQQVGVFVGYRFMEATADAFEPHLNTAAQKAYEEKLRKMGF